MRHPTIFGTDIVTDLTEPATAADGIPYEAAFIRDLQRLYRVIGDVYEEDAIARFLKDRRMTGVDCLFKADLSHFGLGVRWIAIQIKCGSGTRKLECVMKFVRTCDALDLQGFNVLRIWVSSADVERDARAYGDSRGVLWFFHSQWKTNNALLANFLAFISSGELEYFPDGDCVMPCRGAVRKDDVDM